MQRNDEPNVGKQAKSRDWQLRAANWAAVVGVFHALFGLLWVLPLLFETDKQLMLLPVLLFITPAAWHLTGAAGISRSARWGWRMESAFAPIHIAAITIALLRPIYTDWSVLRYSHGAWMPALVFIPIGAAPLLWLMFCLRQCRDYAWTGDDDTPAFEVVPTNANALEPHREMERPTK